MNTALEENEDSSPFASERNSFSKGIIHRQEKRNSCLQRPTKSSKSHTVDSGLSRTEEQRFHLKNANENDCVSGNGFLDGFSKRQTKTQTRPSKSSPHTQCIKKYSVANVYMEHITKFSTSSGGASRHGFDERGLLNTSPDKEFSSQYTRKPSTYSTKTPSPSTQYISTNTSSTTSFKSTDTTRRELHEKAEQMKNRKIDKKDRLKSSTDQIDSPNYIREPLTSSIRTHSPSTRYISTSNTSRSTRYFGEFPEVSEAEWKDIEKKSQNEQKEFLEKFARAGMFREEKISSVEKNVTRGDHIFCHGMFGGAYNHHLLCTDVDGDNIYVIEYSTYIGFAAASYSVVSSNPFVRALIATKQGKLTYEELEKKKAKVRIWPKELERFSVDEVISRALSRINERDYHAFQNNCEHFVTWCKCGLNTSLQVKPWYKPAWDTVKGAGSAAIHGIETHGISKGVPFALKAFGNVSDELLGAISSPLSPVGFALGGVIETAYAASYIHDDWKRMKEGRLSEDQFKINSVTTASQAAFHIAGGITGSVVGSLAGPWGSAAGGVAGYTVGHAVGTAIGMCYEYAPKIKKEIQDKIITVKNMVQSCVKAVKTVVPEIWENVETAFSFLFSWWI